MSSQPLATLDYLAEVAKDWAVSRFATAADSTFVLAPHRFTFDGTTVRRRRLAGRSREAADPLAVARRASKPVAWVRSDHATLLADTISGSYTYEQEVVEIVVVDELDALLIEAACVVRIPGVPPCLGRFSSLG